MNATATAHPYDTADRFPDGDAGSVDIDWRERLGDDLEGWRSAEVVEVEDDDTTWTVVADAFGHVTDVMVDGELVPAYTVDDAPEETDQAEGPMMNYWYPVERGGDDSKVAAWAAQLDGLPVCAVEIDGDLGLALTGGGMDLSWEIAEAHLRLGYRVPSWISLPRMAGRGESEDDRAILRAVLRSKRGAMLRAENSFRFACREWGVDPESVTD